VSSDHSVDSTAATAAPAQELKAAVIVAAIGVVFGDIGTSPLYAFREAFSGSLVASEANVYGVLSLILWALLLVVTLKYVVLILNADNRGEGGVLSLAALALRSAGATPFRRAAIAGLSILGLSLFAGDGLITPAISVLSAVEGLTILSPVFEPYVITVAVAILVALFVVQRHGTAHVGRLFGPVMCLWFGTLAVLGGAEILREPGILQAINPLHALSFLRQHGWQAFPTLGAVLLAITGAEALYADMGHFGRRPIRAAWTGIVLPSLLLNYFGQGALVLRDPAAADHPFFLLAPAWATVPLVLLATGATVIASQAVISGGFSLTRQAVRLGFLPRMSVRHTSATEIGQVYLPAVNWIMLLGVVFLILVFGSSSELAGAYGISVMGALAVDSVLLGVVAVFAWGWLPPLALLLFGAFLVVDMSFLGAAMLKIPEGGWFPLLAAAIGCVIIATWRRGRQVLYRRLYRDALPIETFVKNLRETTVRVSGTAIFMTTDIGTVPNALLHNMKHNQVLHERVVLMKVEYVDEPRVPPEKRLDVQRLGKGFHSLVARYGYLDRPNVPQALDLCRKYGLPIDLAITSFFLGRETLIPSPSPDLPAWQERLYIALSRTALDATAYFELPPGRVVELGTQVEV